MGVSLQKCNRCWSNKHRKRTSRKVNDARSIIGKKKEATKEALMQNVAQRLKEEKLVARKRSD